MFIKYELNRLCIVNIFLEQGLDYQLLTNPSEKNKI